MKIRNSSIAIIAILSLSSCAFLEGLKKDEQAYKAPEPDYLSEKSVAADIKKFFNGDIESFAITQDSAGKINGTYTARISAKWEGNRGTIEQKFKHNDGAQESRTWLITIEPDQTFTAVGHDIAMPSKGNKQIGNAIQMLYTLSLPVVGSDGKSLQEDISFEDMMYQVDDKSMIMISNVRKNNISNGKIISSLKKCDRPNKSSDKVDKNDDKN
jgi:hypothetical protein